MKLQIISASLLLLFAACSEQKDASVAPEATSVAIRSVKVITMPLTDQGGGWDNLSDADLYFTIETAQAVLYKHDISQRKENIQAAHLPYRFTMSRYELPMINGMYWFRLYDYDTPDPDDFIGEVLFNPSLYRMERPVTKVIESANVKLEIELDWK